MNKIQVAGISDLQASCCNHLVHDKLQHSGPCLGYILIGDRPEIKAHVRKRVHKFVGLA